MGAAQGLEYAALPAKEKEDDTPSPTASPPRVCAATASGSPPPHSEPNGAPPVLVLGAANGGPGAGLRKRVGGLTGDGNLSHSNGDSDDKKLGEFYATAVSGNDVLSSCLYTVGIVSVAGGVFAPISVVLVVVMLYFFRSIYGEIGSAIPYNGGAYNVLLTTASELWALLAAALTLISYLATGVTSAVEAAHYLKAVWPFIDVIFCAFLLLLLFAVLNFIGITESALVASIIFSVHILTLGVLIIIAIGHLSDIGDVILRDNYNSPLQPSFFKALLYGFSAATLGITGFETSANYIEEQKPGVFLKTLRNMWLATAIFNPLLAFLSIALLPLSDLNVSGFKEVSLSKLGLVSGGRWLEAWVATDAFFVLSGAVITSYVGVTGLIRRLSQDRWLPGFLLNQNRWRHTNHWIIAIFFVVCASLLFVVNGDVDDLGGVYSIAFLFVMGMFAAGNILLKLKFDEIFANRTVQAEWYEVIAATAMVTIGLLVTVIRGPGFFIIFLFYLLAALVVLSVRLIFCRSTCGPVNDPREKNGIPPPEKTIERLRNGESGSPFQTSRATITAPIDASTVEKHA